jgi:hypothetical protein
MKDFIKSIFSDIDNMASSKRLILLWTGIPIWTFIHIVVFLTKIMAEERATLIMYDFFLIVGALGIVLSEKFTPRNPNSPSNKEIPKETKENNV